MPRLLKLAVILGAVPLLVGTLIYGAWRMTRLPWLEAAGMLTIYMGIAAFVVGAFALVRHLRHESRARRTTSRSLWFEGVLVGGLLLANFPAAAFFSLSAMNIHTRYTVRVHNDSDQPIESLVVTGPGVRVEFGPIAPGEHTHRHIHFSGDGTLDFSARQQELRFGGQVEGYVTGGWSGDTSVRIKPRGVFEIRPDPA
jgi:hypothetical protein